MTNKELVGEFFNTMHKVHKLAGLEGVNCKHGTITPLQVDALLHLHKHKKSTVSTLGKHLQLSSSATTQLVNRLEDSKFIVRESSSDDRRMTILAITSKGEDAFTKMQSSRMSKLKPIISLMPEKDVKELIRIFSNLLAKVDIQKKSNNKS